MGDEMPADPFREGQFDWGWLAGHDTAFLAAHLAAGMAEAHAVELTKAHLQFWLGVMLATQQPPEQQAADAGQPDDGPDSNPM